MRIFAVIFTLFVMVATAAGQDVWQSSQVSVRIGTDTTTKYAAPIAIAGSSNFRMVVLANFRTTGRGLSRNSIVHGAEIDRGVQ